MSYGAGMSMPSSYRMPPVNTYSASNNPSFYRQSDNYTNNDVSYTPRYISYSPTYDQSRYNYEVPDNYTYVDQDTYLPKFYDIQQPRNFYSQSNYDLPTYNFEAPRVPQRIDMRNHTINSFNRLWSSNIFINGQSAPEPTPPGPKPCATCKPKTGTTPATTTEPVGSTSHGHSSNSSSSSSDPFAWIRGLGF